MLTPEEEQVILDAAELITAFGRSEMEIAEKTMLSNHDETRRHNGYAMACFKMSKNLLDIRDKYKD